MGLTSIPFFLRACFDFCLFSPFQCPFLNTKLFSKFGGKQDAGGGLIFTSRVYILSNCTLSHNPALASNLFIWTYLWGMCVWIGGWVWVVVLPLAVTVSPSTATCDTTRLDRILSLCSHKYPNALITRRLEQPQSSALKPNVTQS